MALSGSFRRFWLCVALLVSPALSAGPALVPDTDSGLPVIEYSVSHDLLVVQDPEPLLRVYADGLVRVHIPAYMKGAGDYRMDLGPNGLQDLLASLDRNGLMVHNKAGARIERKAAVDSLTGLYSISDATRSYVSIRLAKYKPNSELGGPLKRNLRKRIAWANLEQDAKRFPGFVRAQLTDVGVQTLRALVFSPDLQRLP